MEYFMKILLLALLLSSTSFAAFLQPSQPVTVTTAAYSSSTGTLNKEMLTGNTSGWYDTQNLYSWFAADIYTTTTVTGGVITFEQTNDTANDASGITLSLQDATVLTQTNVTTLTLAATTVKHYHAAITSRYIRFRISTAFAGTGTVGATVNLRTTSYAPLVVNVNQATAASLNATVAGNLTTVATVTAAGIAPGTTNGCLSPGSTLVSISGATSGTAATQLIALVAAKKIFICSMTIMAVSGTTPTFSLVQGTGTNCATSQVVLVNAFSTATAGQTFAFANPVAVSVSADAVCYLQTGTTPIVNYTITYTQQ